MSEQRRKPYGPISLLDFQNLFPSEQSCWDYLVKMRWPDGFECPRCQKKSACLNQRRKVFECYNCGAQISATTGTAFHKSRQPLQKWFWAIFLMSSSNKGVSMLYLQTQLGIKSYRAAWLMGQKIRSAMIARDKLYQISGQAQVDEIHIGGKQARKNNKKIKTNKTPFLIAVQESKDGKPLFVAFKELEGGKMDQIKFALEKTLKKGTKIKSDGHSAYKDAKNVGDYEVQIVSRYSDPEKANEHLKWVNTITSNLKRFLLSTYHGVHPQYRTIYLAEFAYRFNRRHWPHEVFDRLLFACMNAAPTTLPELRA